MRHNWHIAVLSKDSWWHPRRARKQLLYQALVACDAVASILHANGSRLWWRPRLDDVDMPVPDGMEVFTPTLLLPGERLEPVRRLNRYFMAGQIRKRWRHCGKEQALFFYNPRDVDAAILFRHQARVIFDWTEDWADFYGNSSLVGLQERAVREADAVVAVTEVLADRARQLRGDDRVLCLPNATALPVRPEVDVHVALKDIPSPRIGYLGHLGPWFDVLLVEKLARQRPDYAFVLAGGVGDDAARRLEDLPNVHCIGVYPLDELPALLAGFDLCIAPYVTDNIQGDASKLYDYFTCGKPVVTTPVPGVERFGDAVRIASGEQAWLEALDRGLEERPAVSEARLKLAALHDWDHRAQTLIRWLGELG